MPVKEGVIICDPTPEVLAGHPGLNEAYLAGQEKWHRAFPKESFSFSCLFAWPRLPGHDWPVLVPQRVTNNWLFEQTNQRFGATHTTRCLGGIHDLDIYLPYQHLTTLRWFKRSEEPDQELMGITNSALYDRHIASVTLQERLWMGIEWFMDTGQHLDRRFQTLVAGSHMLASSDTLRVWYDGGVEITWTFTNHPSRLYGTRSPGRMRGF